MLQRRDTLKEMQERKKALADATITLEAGITATREKACCYPILLSELRIYHEG